MPKLTTQERGGYTDAIRLTAADLAAIAAGSGTRTVATIPAGGAVELVSLSTSGTFSATPVGTLAVGISGTAGKYIAAVTPGTTVASAGRFNTGTGFTTGFTQAIENSATDVPVIITVGAGSNYSTLTSGEVVVALRILDPVRFNNA